ncbi:hypothetical protein [Actinosynnema sp. ALI-1.44]|uniref:hypothetical protein n=1 Tax=Actinosynnema sp. ALI-1.44 TaxID=1933779 RepID=UPI001873BF5B|nr:hypothetical protein [Actinosynnema sp. ALI-1.44]
MVTWEDSVNDRWKDLPRRTVRDVWADRTLGRFADGFEATIPPHGSKLLKVW